MNYLDILVRASISVPAAAKNVKLTNEVAQVGSVFNANHMLWLWLCYLVSKDKE